MPGQRRFDEETRARAVRMYRDRLRDYPEESRVNPSTLRNWVEREEIDGSDPG